MARNSRGSRKAGPKSDNQPLAEPPKQRSYSEEERYTALACIKLCQGNVHRAAVAMEMPYSTLRGWWDEAQRDEANFVENPHSFRLKEKLGDIATKLEHKLHDVVDSITPDVIRKATLSQRGVFMGIAFDKLRVARGQGLDPDYQSELARLLGVNKNQLPNSIDLEPGQALPRGFLGPIIDVEPNTAPPTCDACSDSHLITSPSGKTAPCPFCVSPTPSHSQPPIEIVHSQHDGHLYNGESASTLPSCPSEASMKDIVKDFICSNPACSYSEVSFPENLNSTCPKCSTGTLQLAPAPLRQNFRCNSCSAAFTFTIDISGSSCPDCTTGSLQPLIDDIEDVTAEIFPNPNAFISIRCVSCNWRSGPISRRDAVGYRCLYCNGVTIPDENPRDQSQSPSADATAPDDSQLLDSLSDDDSEN